VTKGQAGACPGRARAIPCTMRAPRGTCQRQVLSQLSHGLVGRYETVAATLDTNRALASGYGLRRTGRTGGIDLRIRRLDDG